MADFRHSRESGNLGIKETFNQDFLWVNIQKRYCNYLIYLT
jgi:hypothetical protein